MIPIIFAQLTTVVAIAAVVSVIMMWLKQPLIVGYIITGIIVGPTILGLVEPSGTIEIFGEIGVALLLFLVGLGLSPRMVRDVGTISVVAGLAQVIFTTIVGFGLATLMGFNTVTSLYISAAFTFSSTIVILQLLYTKEDQNTLYGRISTGFMLVQDVVAMVIFLFLSSAPSAGNPWAFGFAVFSKVVVIILAIYLLHAHIVPRLDRYFASSNQVLFLFALAICFIFAFGAVVLGFSFELGALLAGIVLSASPYQREIASRIYPLRDFFLVMFFVVLGTQVGPGVMSGNVGWVIVFSLFVLIANPLIVMLVMRPAGYTLRTSFYTGLTVAQISEFSLILLAVGVSLGHLPASIIGPATVVGLVTIFGSSYFMMHNQQLYDRMEPMLRKIFGEDLVEELQEKAPTASVILFGCHRLGAGLIDKLEKKKLSFLVIDHDPEIISILKAGGVRSAYGSADNTTFLDTLHLGSAKLIISTIPELNANLTLLPYIKRKNKKAVIIAVAYHISQAEELYRAGASYVILPPYLGRRYLADLIEENGLRVRGYKKERERHNLDFEYIKEQI